ncbi:MAG: GNAT family N-acetyltransferase [Oscillospiraceae bacterium]|nr:GNAT family N-acetyltransferase [Oscillospiraceae bacterium]
MKTFSIRIMTFSDYDECFKLWNLNGDAFGRADSTLVTFNKILTRNPDTCFVAVTDNKIIGTIAAEFGGDGAYISHLNVSPDYRRQGVATDLVDTVEGKLDELGVRKSRILVFADNETAKLFWNRRGYAAHEDIIFMDRKL